MSDSFLFYRSFYEALEDIPEEEQLKLIKAVCQYALDGIVPEITGAARGMFKLIKPQIDANTKRRIDGSKGGRKPLVTKKETSGSTDKKPVVTNKAENEKPNVNVNDNVNVNVNDKEKKSRFAPPSLDEVRDYCQERNNNVDPETFIDFYSAKGWKVGNQPMKDWKACIRTWEKRDRGRAAPKEEKGKFDDIASRLLRESMGDVYGGSG